MARTFRATLSLSLEGKEAHGRVPIDEKVVEEMGLRPGETVRATMRGTDFTGRVSGSLRAPGLVVPGDIVRSLKLREGQGVRVTINGRA